MLTSDFPCPLQSHTERELIEDASPRRSCADGLCKAVIFKPYTTCQEKGQHQAKDSVPRPLALDLYFVVI